MIKQLLYLVLSLIVLIGSALSMDHQEAPAELNPQAYICVLNTFVNLEAKKLNGFKAYVNVFENSPLSFDPKHKINYVSSLNTSSPNGKIAKTYIESIYECRNSDGPLGAMGINIYSMGDNTDSLRVGLLKELDKTCARVADACFTFQYGKNHPFNVEDRNYLKTVLFYKLPIFKQLLKAKYDDEQQKKGSNNIPTMAVWSKSIYQSIIANKPSNLYVALSQTLDFLGVEAPIMPEDCDISTLQN